MIVSVESSTQEHIVVQGFLLQSIQVQGHFTSVDRETKGEGALSLGTYLLGSFGKAREELSLYTGSIILYFLLYLIL
jgi:hypothetical protein